MKDEKQISIENYYKHLVQQIKEFEELGDKAYSEYTKLKRDLIEDNSIQTSRDKELYKRYLEIIKDEQYFDLEHIYALGIEFDILIFLGKKGCGKSYWLNKKINEIVDNGGQVFFMRITEADINAGARLWIEDYESKLRLVGSIGGYRLVHKEKTAPDSNKPLVCGYASGIKTAAKWKGGSFKDIKLICIDEITDDRKGAFDKHDVDMLFTHVLNSIERTKEIPLICFGNADQTLSKVNPFLAAFDIPENIKFKYSEKKFPGSNKTTKFLYINSGGMFNSGIQNSKLAGMINDVMKVKGIMENTKVEICTKLTNLDFSVACTPYVCILFFLNKEIVALHATQTNINTEEDPEYWYFFKLDKFEPSYTANFIDLKFTDNEAIYNQYGGIVQLLGDKEMFYIWRDVIEIFKDNKAIIKSGTELNTLIPKIVEDKKRHYKEWLTPKRRLK